MKYLLSINYIYWLVLSTLLFAVGEFLSKKFAMGPRWGIVILLIFVDVLSLLTWLPAILQKNQLSIVGTIWSVLSLALTVLIGMLIFGEKLNGYGLAGIVTAAIAIALLTLS